YHQGSEHYCCHSTVNTTFPRACPCSAYRTASVTWLSVKRLSITGLTFPPAMRSRMMARSSLSDFAMNMRNLRLEKDESVIARTSRAKKEITFALAAPPAITYLPFGFRMRLLADQECCQTRS